MSWKAINCFAKGTSHKKTGMPCQDYGDYRRTDNGVILGAVADGAGSAKHSDIGSKLAVETTLNYLSTQNYDLQQPISEKEAKGIFAQNLKNVQNALKQEASNNRYSLRDLASTLLVFIATPNWLAAMQIGDGFIVVRFEQDSDYQLLFPPDKGEYANETTFVISANVNSDMQVRVMRDDCKFICASTDGLERLAITFRDGKPFNGFFKPLEKGLEQTNNLDNEQEQLNQWIDSEQVNTRTDDDKHLLLCLYEGHNQSDKKREVSTIPAQEEPTEQNNSQSAQNDVDSQKEANSSQPPPKKYESNQTIRALFQSLIVVSFIYYVLLGYLLGIIYYFLWKNILVFRLEFVILVASFILVLLLVRKALLKLLPLYRFGNKRKKIVNFLTVLIGVFGIWFGTILSFPLKSLLENAYYYYDFG